jgi:hypothetical protein
MFLKKIIDIKISDYGISITRDANITSKIIENQVKNLQYSGQGKLKDYSSENAKLPPFIQVFYYLFFRQLSIPSEELFFNTYIEWLGGIDNEKINYNNQHYNPEGIMMRLKRAYPSIIRDFHFLYLLQESKRFDSVEYSLKLDYYNGLDIKVTYYGKDIYVSLFIDTTRSNYYKSRKKTRHDYSNIIELEFNVNFDSLTKHGSIYLLNITHVNILEEKIKEITKL